MQTLGRPCRPARFLEQPRPAHSIQFTAPGTPDLYQGDELWNFALVDPDNRRPVDYEKRKQLLDEVIMGVEGDDESRRDFLRNLVESPEDGRIKLHVIRGSLAARRNHPRLVCSRPVPAPCRRWPCERQTPGIRPRGGIS